MKYKDFTAFTLAEVLITLGIIGVVAAMTMPSLVAKYQVKQYETALKEVYSILSNGFKQVMVDTGCPDLECTGIFISAGEGLINNSSDTEFQKNIDVIAKNVFKVVKSYKGDEITPRTIKYLKGDKTAEFGGNSGYEMYLPNGTIVAFQNFGCGEVPNNEGSLKNLCGFISVDLNGEKLPNTMGKDIFALGGLYNNGRIVPNTSLLWAQSKVGVGKGENYTNYWRNNSRLCGKPNVSLKNDTTPEIVGQDCFARVLENNFEIDYLK